MRRAGHRSSVERDARGEVDAGVGCNVAAGALGLAARRVVPRRRAFCDPVILPDGVYFRVSEFACHTGEPYPEAWADRWANLVTLCDRIRERWSRPLTVVSGYRTSAYNQGLVNGDAARGSHQVASASYHVQGMAADLRPETSEEVPQLLDVILRMYAAGELPELGGCADYPVSCWVHVDCGKAADGHLRRWIGR